MALLIVRVPAFREWYESQKKSMVVHAVRMALATPKTYEAFREAAESEGRQLPENVSYEALCEFIEDEDRYTLELDQTAVLRGILEQLEPLAQVLSARKWVVFVAERPESDFITSDRPVSLIACSPKAPRFLGFGAPHTEVGLPLSRKLALVGSWDADEEVIATDALGAGHLNWKTYEEAARFVYSGTETFRVSRPRTAD